MFESLLSWIISNIASSCAPVFEKLTEIVDMGIDFFAQLFPSGAVLYGVLQGIALGFAVAIAIIHLLKFFVSTGSKDSESPISVVVHMFFAIGLVLFGGYILEFVVDIFKGPFSTLMDAGTTTRMTFADMTWDGFADFIDADLLSGAKLIIELIVLISLVINIFKFALELCERWMMVGVMVYTAPLGFSTVASQATMGIFQKWWQMVLSANIMMMISAWSLRMLMDILVSPSDLDMFTRAIFAMAFCRVAQRFDSYIQQLGVSVASTSGNMLHEITGTAGAMMSASKILGGTKSGGGVGKGDSGNGEDGSWGDVLGANPSPNGSLALKAAGFIAAGPVGFAAAKEGSRTVSAVASGFKRGFQDTMADSSETFAKGKAWHAIKNGAAQAKDNFNDANLKTRGNFAATREFAKSVRSGEGLGQALDNAKQKKDSVSKTSINNKMDAAYNNYKQGEARDPEGKLTFSENKAIDARIAKEDQKQQEMEDSIRRSEETKKNIRDEIHGKKNTQRDSGEE